MNMNTLSKISATAAAAVSAIANQDSLAFQLLSWKALDAIEKAAKATKEELRAAFFFAAAASGKTTSKGWAFCEEGGAKAIREEKRASVPNDADLKKLLESEEILLSECYDVIQTVVLNPSKLDSLIARGLLVPEEVDALRKTTYSLKVEVAKDAAQLFETLK